MSVGITLLEIFSRASFNPLKVRDFQANIRGESWQFLPNYVVG